MRKKHQIDTIIEKTRLQVLRVIQNKYVCK